MIDHILKVLIILSNLYFYPKRSITLDSLVADPIILIQKKSRINKSVVGTNLSLETNSKINYSLLLDNIKIGKE
jgi:ADP-glucose pyrophosphorylase